MLLFFLCCLLFVGFIPLQPNAMGSLHNIDFGVFWASWGGSGKEPGSGNRFQVLMGSDGSESGCGFEGFGVPGFDGF